MRRVFLLRLIIGLFFALIFTAPIHSKVPKGMLSNNNYYDRRKVNISSPIGKVSNFSGATVIVEDGEGDIEIIGPKGSLDNVSIKTQGRELIINYAVEEYIASTSQIVVHVYSDEISNIGNFSVGVISVPSIDTGRLEILSGGSGPILLDDVDCTTLKVTLTGSGPIVIRKADTTVVDLLLQGSGVIRFNYLDATSVTSLNQGSGLINFDSLDATKVKITQQGSGLTNISGDCTSAYLLNQGTGMIKAGGLKCDHKTIVQQGLGPILVK